MVTTAQLVLQLAMMVQLAARTSTLRKQERRAERRYFERLDALAGLSSVLGEQLAAMIISIFCHVQDLIAALTSLSLLARLAIAESASSLSSVMGASRSITFGCGDGVSLKLAKVSHSFGELQCQTDLALSSCAREIGSDGGGGTAKPSASLVKL